MSRWNKNIKICLEILTVHISDKRTILESLQLMSEKLCLYNATQSYMLVKKKHGTCLTWLTIVYYVFENIKYSHSKHQTSWKIKISGPVHRFPAVKWFVSIYSYLKTKTLSQKINFLGCGLLVFKCVINRVVGRHQKLVGVIRFYMMTVKYC